MSAAHPLAPLLARARITQAELARQLGLHTSIISLWCCGKRPVPQQRVAAVAELLQVSPEEIADPPPPMPVLEIAPPSGPSRAAIWLQAEAKLAMSAAEFRAQMGQVRYMPAIEPIMSGPVPRCAQGHFGCARMHPRLVRCRQCERRVRLSKFDLHWNCCHSCRNAAKCLYNYWRRRGMRVSDHKHHRLWMQWANES